MEPGVEPVRIAEPGKVAPGDHQRFLHGILGPVDVAKDPLGDREEAVAARRGSGRHMPPGSRAVPPRRDRDPRSPSLDDAQRGRPWTAVWSSALYGTARWTAFNLAMSRWRSGPPALAAEGASGAGIERAGEGSAARSEGRADRQQEDGTISRPALPMAYGGIDRPAAVQEARIHMHRRRLLARGSVAAATLMALLMVAPSSALAGSIPGERWGGTVIHEGSGFDCSGYGGDFTEAWHVVETVSGMTFFDGAGDPVRELVHVGWIETVTREDTGQSIDVRGDWTVSFDYGADTVSVTGAFRVGTAPAEGVLIHDAGRFAILPGGLFLAGPHDVQFDPDGTYCGALAGLGD